MKKCFMKNSSFSYMIVIIYLKPKMSKLEVLLVLLIRKDKHKQNSSKIMS